MEFQFPSSDVQRVLANLVKVPHVELMTTVRNTLPKVSEKEQIACCLSIKALISKAIGTELKSGKVEPVLVDRLSYSWTILQNAQKSIKSYKGDLPNIVIGMSQFRDMISTCFPFEPHDELASAISSRLGLGPSGAFVLHFREFMRLMKPRKLSLQFIDNMGAVNWDNIHRLITWLIRKCSLQYVDTRGDRDIDVHLSLLLDEFNEKIPEWTGITIPNTEDRLNVEIENCINDWLTYSCLEGDNRPDDREQLAEIAREFQKANDLNVKVKIHKSKAGHDQAHDRMIKELESNVGQYVTEIKRLEEEVRQLRGHQGQSEAPREEQRHSDTGDLAVDAMCDLLRSIDSKYSFDLLQEIQLGTQTSLTMRNFIGHLFFVFRKMGLCTYPSEEDFELPYELSGLYECTGFEISPGQTERVRVEKKGWAIRTDERVFPVRRAQIRRL